MKCPACGFEQVPMEVLKSNRFNAIANIHKDMPWWNTQPYEILRWAKDLINVKSVLDVGCGDGRWVEAFISEFPNIEYVGLDLYKEHIEDCVKRFPQLKFYHGDFLTNSFLPRQFNLLLFAGVFNPKMKKEREISILNEAKKLGPDHILTTFDLNCSGYLPERYLLPEYKYFKSFYVSTKNQDQNQFVFAEIYERR